MNVGDWVGVPLRAVMRDECLFPDANEFQGFRFAPAKSIPSDLHYTPSSETGTEFTDLSTPVGYMWGAGNITWYANMERRQEKTANRTSVLEDGMPLLL